MKTVKIETNLWEDVQDGDRLEILRDNCNFIGIRVHKSGNKLFLDEKSFGRPNSTRKFFLHQIPEDWKLRSIVRPESIETDKPKTKWRFFSRQEVAPKVGSQEAIRAAIESTDSIVNYWDTRIQLGDPLFDQWMVDAYESAKAASENLKKLLKIMEG